MKQSHRFIIYITVAVLALLLVYLSETGRSPLRSILGRGAPTYTYRVLNVYPHDPQAWTQGLVFADGVLYEGTGRHARSSLREVDIATGEILNMHRLPDNLFGEGVAIVGDKIFQLTFRSGTAFVYDRDSFRQLDRFTYSGQGWGLTFDGKHLIMSDGTSVLYFLEPQDFKRIKQIIVKDGDRAVIGINELEYVKGEIYANAWPTDLIARISPKTGRVVGWVDLSGLLSPDARTDSTGVLNGIAYDRAGDRLFVTGKLWPHLFEIQVVQE
jgi:glutamine cyclotransferase